ncbi:chromate transporter [Gorillibacterium massiliense]|uniref:chromate transporter n=1 Tax=Gorillibacterium massiliense TaxID=1280390 RepID=UPI0004B16485|nr:chromate transporter [Gorillibacterium massiliense]
MPDQKVSWKLLGEVFLSFLKIAPVTFGGGYAVIPAIEQEVVEKRKWLEEQETADVLAVSQSIPGAIAINSATFIGYKIARIPGAIAAMLGMLLPTFLIVIGLCAVFLHIQDSPKAAAAFKAIKASIVALIVYAGLKIARSAIFDKTTLCTVLATTLLMVVTGMNPVFVMLSGIAVGILQVKAKELLGLAVRLNKEDDHEHFVYKDYFIGDGI